MMSTGAQIIPFTGEYYDTRQTSSDIAEAEARLMKFRRDLLTAIVGVVELFNNPDPRIRDIAGAVISEVAEATLMPSQRES